MRGGVVVLPANEHVNHRHVLRSADHMKPMIVGISGFGSPYETRSKWQLLSGPIPRSFMEFLEEVPASYLVVENNLIEPQRRIDYETFLARAVLAGRLRFINRFDGRDDLYAVVKTEPQAKAEAPLPFARRDQSSGENYVRGRSRQPSRTVSIVESGRLSHLFGVIWSNAALC